MSSISPAWKLPTMGRLAGCAKRLRAKLDLRFEILADETSFVVDRESYCAATLALAAVFVFFGVPSLCWGLFGQEMSREDYPLTYALEDPRTWNAIPALVLWVVAILTVALGCVRMRWGKLARLSFEKVTCAVWAVASFTLVAQRTWITAVLSGWTKQGGEGSAPLWLHDMASSEATMILTVDAMITYAGITNPVRIHYLCILVGCAFGSYAMSVAIFKSPDTRMMPIQCMILLVLSIFSLVGAWKGERNERATWIHGHQLKKKQLELECSEGLATGMQAIASRLCDLVFQLSPDLTVCHQEVSHTSFFCRPLFGEPFSDLISECERERFRTLIAQASSSGQPQCMHFTLLRNGSAVEAEILAVDTGKAHCRYIIGARVDVPLGAIEDTEGVECTTIVRRPSTLQHPARRGPVSVTSTRGDTTHTGHIFNSGDVGDIKTLGHAEHWVLESKELVIAAPPRLLGTGGYGMVFAATYHGKAVAVKLGKKTPGRGMPPDLANELRSIRHLRHPNIVLFHGVVLIEAELSEISIVYEFVDGPTLAHFVHGSPSPRARFGLIFDMLCALRYLHAQRPAIVHGDLKSGNVMVELMTSRPRAKLIDFGLSHFATERSKKQGGTRAWRAPETYTKASPPATSSDVFSFGWLVHLVTTGQRPFGDKRDEDLDKAVSAMRRTKCVGPLPMPPGSPYLEDSKAMSEACLKFEPSERPAVVSLFGNLSSWLSLEEKCALGFEIAQSILLPSVMERLEINSSTSWIDSSAEGSMCVQLSGPSWHIEDLDLKDVRVEVEAKVGLRILSKDCKFVPGLGKLTPSSSFAERLVDAEVPVIWLCAIANDVATGVASMHSPQKFGRVCLRPPNGVAVDAKLTAELTATFKENRVATLRLSDWSRLVPDNRYSEGESPLQVSL